MRYDGIEIEGVGPFRERVSVDFSQLPGVLCAISGTNGAGKSTLLSCLLAGLTRQMADGQSLKDYATSRDAFVEVKVTNGRAFTLRQEVDAVSGKSQALVIDRASGKAIIQTMKVSDADAWVRENFPPTSVIYSSIFGRQGDNGFVELDAADRRKVINRVTGNEHLEELATKAREHHKGARQQLETLVARIRDEQERGADVSKLEMEAFAAKKNVAAAARELAQAEGDLSEAREQKETRAAEETLKRVALNSEEMLQREVLCLNAELKVNAESIEELEEIVANGDAIREAVRVRDSLGLELTTLRTNARAHVGEDKVVYERLGRRSREAEYERLAVDWTEMRHQHERLSQEVGYARRMKPEVDDDCRDLATGAAALRREADQLVEGDRDKSERRIELLRLGLQSVIKEVSDRGAVAGRALKVDNKLAALDVWPQIEALREQQQKVEERAAAAVLRQQTIDQALEREGALEDLATDLASIDADTKAAGKAVQGAVERLYEAEMGLADDVGAIAGFNYRINELQPLHDAARLKAEFAPKLAAGEARLEVLREQRDDITAKGVEKLKALHAVVVPPVITAYPDVDLHERAVQEKRERLATRRGLLTHIEEALERARVSEAKLEEFAEAKVKLEEEVADWKLLTLSLGKDGLQSLELDAAGPELTAMANDLLHSCYGPRFSVSFESTQKLASGKGVKEGCWVMVHDTKTSRLADAKHFCGGEKVFIGEAADLSLAMLGCRRAGMENPTLIRDERGAALAAENGPLYIAMLRRAAELVNADRVLFVSHDESLKALADCRLELANGKVQVITS